MDTDAWLAAHPAAAEGPVRAAPIRLTHSPARVAIIAAYRDAAARQAGFWMAWGMIALAVEWEWRAARAQAMLERARGD